MGGSFNISNPLDQTVGALNDISKNFNRGLSDIKDPNYAKKVLGLNDAAEAEKRQKAAIARQKRVEEQERLAYEELRRRKINAQRSLFQRSAADLTSFSSAPNFWQVPGWDKLGAKSR